jgi:transcriptional regulator with XRE-family HTH domain
VVARAADAVPNTVLYNLRDAAGETQQDVADALNELGRKRGASVTANQVSRWERGITFPSALYRKLLAEHFGVSLQELGFTRPRATPRHHTGIGGEAFAIHTDVLDPLTTPRVTASQAEWREVRRRLNAHRAPLAREAARLYGEQFHIADTGLIAAPAWLPPAPVELADFAIRLDSEVPEPAVTGVEPASAGVRALASEHDRYARYSQAVRDIDHPRLFENRLAWRVTGVDWDRPEAALTFGASTYFEAVDVAEAVAHEMTHRHVNTESGAESSSVLPAAWRGLTFRRYIGDPFDLARRPVVASTDTLTIRADDDCPTFILHNRSAGKVAVAGGMLHIMPAGVFQPSSILPAAQVADFDLWRNIAREYSEEFLGTAEHGGDGRPADFTAKPLASFQEALDAGTIQVYCLGVALDALTLFGEILTVAVYDGPTYDQLFADMVDSNDEGAVVKTGRAEPTPALPFTRHVLDELVKGGRLAPAAAGCLELAWRHRTTILERN